MSGVGSSSWSKHCTDGGDEYYYNEDTQVSQWERPDEYVSDTEITSGECDVDLARIDLVEEALYSEEVQDAQGVYEDAFSHSNATSTVESYIGYEGDVSDWQPAVYGQEAYAQSFENYATEDDQQVENEYAVSESVQYDGDTSDHQQLAYAEDIYASADNVEEDNVPENSDNYFEDGGVYGGGAQLPYTEDVYQHQSDVTDSHPAVEDETTHSMYDSVTYTEEGVSDTYGGGESQYEADAEHEPCQEPSYPPSSYYDPPQQASSLYQSNRSSVPIEISGINDTVLVEAPTTTVTTMEASYDTEGNNGGDTREEEDEEDEGHVLHFEFDDSADMLDELTRLCLFEPPPPTESNFILSGKWSKVACKKIEVLQMCLETAGTEEEWEWAFNNRDCMVMNYLQLFMDPAVHPMLKDGASRCLAYGFMAYPLLWSTYSKLNPSIDHICAVLGSSSVRIKALLAMPPESRPSVPYVGFDERDVEDYNMTNMEEFDEADEVVKGPYDMEGSVDSSTAVSIWLLVLFQMIRSPSRVIADSFLSRDSDGVDTRDGYGDEMSTASVDDILQAVTDILLASNTMKEDAYLQCMKVVAAINWQVPSKDHMGSSEIAELCANLQFMEEVAAVNVSEGLMHLLNDIGHPEHNVPEALPCLQLCCDLVTAQGFDGFFYSNDIKVLVDVIIRELTNLPLVCSSKQHGDDDIGIIDSLAGPVEGSLSQAIHVDELTRQMYLKLTYALMTRSSWPDIEDYYKKSELQSMLRAIVETGEISNSKTLELISQVLRVRYQSI